MIRKYFKEIGINTDTISEERVVKMIIESHKRQREIITEGNKAIKRKYVNNLFKVCINRTNIEQYFVRTLIECYNNDDYKDLSIQELFELLFWDIMLSDWNIKNSYIQLLFVKYGDSFIDMFIEYLKQSEKDYGLNEKDKVLFRYIIELL